MKKFSLLLLAAAVAMGAAAGNKIVDPKTFKTNAKLTKEFIVTKNVPGRTDLGMLQDNALKNFGKTQKAMFKAEGEATVWDFENPDQLAEWMIVDNDGDGYSWAHYGEGDKMTAHSGVGLVSSASYINDGDGGGWAVTPDNWLISPAVTLTGKVGFFAAGQDPSFAAEVFAVYVSVGTSNIEDFVKISDDLVATGAYQLYEFDLSEYEGMEGYIAIRHYNVSDQFMLNVDDVMVGDYEVEPVDPVDPVDPEVPTVITEIPEGCQVFTYARNSACLYQTIDWNTFTYVWTGGLTDGKFKVAFDLNSYQDGFEDVYIQNPLWQYNRYNSWVKGTYDVFNGIISIPTGQYLSWSSYGYGIQLYWGYTYTFEDEDEYGEMTTYLGYAIDERATEIQFQVEDDALYLIGSEGNIYADFPENFNAMGMVGKWSDEDDIECVEFINVDDFGYALPIGTIVNAAAATPADPTNVAWYDEGDDSGYSYLGFTLPTTDVNGNALDQELLSYSVYVDFGNGPELFTFDAATYSYDLYEDMTEIPSSIYSGGYDFYSSRVYFYGTLEGIAYGYEPLFTHNIGIQVHYTVDGVKNSSNIVWAFDPNTAVEEVNATKTVANVRYFNVAGQEMAQPNGMTIQVTTYTDGTQSAVKVVK